jgi:hypothetical protein
MGQFFEYEFMGRKPSKKQVLKQVEQGIKTSPEMLTISWGENWVQIIKLWNGSYQGNGWIKGISGYDIANDLNAKQTRNTLNLWNT